MLFCHHMHHLRLRRPDDKWVHAIPKTSMLDYSQEPDATFLREMAALVSTARTVSGLELSLVCRFVMKKINK